MRRRYRFREACEFCGKVYAKPRYLIRHLDEWHYYPEEFGHPRTPESRSVQR